MRVAVLTTSYPRYPGDAAGRFVADAVEHVRSRGRRRRGDRAASSFGTTGSRTGTVCVGNLRARPWLGLFVPALLASFVRAARGARRRPRARALAAVRLGRRPQRQAVRRPGVGDGRRARRACPRAGARCASRRAARDRGVARPRRPRLGRSARARCGSSRAASTCRPRSARRPSRRTSSTQAGCRRRRACSSSSRRRADLTARRRRRRPSARRNPRRAGLCPARRAAAAVRARRGRRLPVATRRLRRRLPRGDGTRAAGRRDARSAGCSTSSSTARPASLVPPRDPVALRAALQRLLADPELRRSLGAAGRERARERFSWDAVTDATLAAYAEAAGTMAP